MMDISLGGLIGAVIGTLIAGVNYHLFIGVLERRIRERPLMQTPSEAGDSLDQRLALLRRAVLTIDLLLFAGVGYWLGHAAAG
jgi:hypothetical protein